MAASPSEIFSQTNERLANDLPRPLAPSSVVSSIGSFLFAALFALVPARSGDGSAAWIWVAAVGAAVVGRSLLCRRSDNTTDSESNRLAWPLTALALVEGLLWGGALWLLRATTPLDALVQIGLSGAVVIALLMPYGVLLRAWLASAAPIALGQAVLLLTALPQRADVLLPALAVAYAICGIAAHRLHATLRAPRQRTGSERVAADQELALAELNSSRDQLRLALEAIDAGIADTDVNTGERFFSLRYTEILGYADLDSFVRDYRFSESVHPEDRQRIVDARKAHIDHGVPFEQEFRMRTAVGDYIWVQARGESTRDSKGRATRFVMSIVDITKRRDAEDRLVASERRYRALVDASPSLIFTCDRAGKLTLVSGRASRTIYGFEPRQVLGQHVTAFNAPEFSYRRFLRSFLPVFRGEPVYDVELVHQTRDGESRVVMVSAVPNLDEAGELESVFGICTDITAQKQRESELAVALRNQQVIFDAAGEGIAFVRQGRIENANDALAAMLGVSRQWLIGRTASEIFADAVQWLKVRELAREAAFRGDAANHELMLRAIEPSGGGRSVWTQLTANLVSGGDGDDETMILVLTDITPLKRREELAWHQANHDELTGLPNRRLLMENARRLLSVAMRRDRLAALMVLDLDGFKDINDVFGHAFGDAMLRRLAIRMSRALREYDLIARTGGDEFVVVLPEIDAPDAARRVAEKLIAAAAEEVQINGRTAKMGASVGIAIFPRDGHDFDALFKCADEAMYQSKSSGKNRYTFASSEDDATTAATQSLPAN